MDDRISDVSTQFFLAGLVLLFIRKYQTDRTEQQFAMLFMVISALSNIY
jgi:hypothetical protein